MCCHKFYIYATCGHSVFGPEPLVPCVHFNSTTYACQTTAHPFQTWNLDTLCPPCDETRTKLLNTIASSQRIRFHEWKWRVSYGMPAHGKDLWGRKADERARLEQEIGKRTKRGISLRFSWRRKPDKGVMEKERAPSMLRSYTAASSVGESSRWPSSSA